MKKIPFREVLGIMHSGVSHVNMYKKHDLEKLAREKEMKKNKNLEPEEKRGLLQANEDANESALRAELERDEDGDSVVSYFYEDEQGNVQKKKIKKSLARKGDDNNSSSDLDKN